MNKQQLLSHSAASKAVTGQKAKMVLIISRESREHQDTQVLSQTGITQLSLAAQISHTGISSLAHWEDRSPQSLSSGLFLPKMGKTTKAQLFPQE